MIIKRQNFNGRFLEDLMVCEGLRKPCKGQEPSYTGACRHSQNLGFMSISIDMICCLKRNTSTYTPYKSGSGQP